jgi:AGZA family xanthine/uracil permease-like MFS transporter
LGARAGYSTLNGLVIAAICLTGTVRLIDSIVPLEAGIAIVLWIGIIITAQAFQASPLEHAPAVAVGLFPAIAAWGATVVVGAFNVSGGATVHDVIAGDAGRLSAEVNGFLIHGLLVMERGYIFTCMLLAAIAAFLIDRRFYTAAAWSLVAAVFAFTGLTHAYQLSTSAEPQLRNRVDFLFVFQAPADGFQGFRAEGICVGYLLFALIFVAFGWYVARRPQQTGDHSGNSGCRSPS